MSPRGTPSRRQLEREAQKVAREQAPARAIAETRAIVVSAQEQGARLDKLIAQRLPELSRARVQQLIEEGLVLVGGAQAKASERPLEGAAIEVKLPVATAARLEPVSLNLPVLHDDPHLAVIDKPAGIAVHPGAGVWNATIVHGLLHQLPGLRGIGGELRPGIVHRLDKDTSGCLVVAKSEPALRGLQALFKARLVDKRYRALVHGAPPDEGEFDTFHGRHPVDRKRFSTKVGEGRRAITRFRVLERFDGAAFVEIELFTGRTHQIRAHFADAGFPLLADVLYGGARKDARLPEGSPVRRAAAAVGRQALHAFRLAFDHPIVPGRVSCEAPLPADFAAALSLLR